MFIEKEKYCWNSLRKGRLLGFENDIEEAYTAFKNHMTESEDITAKVFESIAENSQFSILIHCRAEEEDEEEYMQLLYQIIIDNFFVTQNQFKQIFSVYALYFLYSQLEKKRKINVDMDFLDVFLSFLKKNAEKTDNHWMMIAKKLIESCVTIGIKTGLKTYLIKANGEPARKGKYHPLPTKKLDTKNEDEDQDKEEENQYMSTLKTEISQLEMSLESYSKGKEKFNNDSINSSNGLHYSDKNFGVRLIKKYNQYEKLLSEKYNQEKIEK